MHRPDPKRRQAGFTLPEILVAVVIEVIIVGALGMAFVGILNDTKSVNQSLSQSGDAQIAAVYIIADARNSSGPEISLTTSTCADPSPPVAGGTLVMQIGFNATASLTGATTSNVIDYVLASNQLMRRECTNGALVSDRIVANSVASVGVACSAIANCSGTPTSITATIAETADSTGNSYIYSLTGAFRKLDGSGAPSAPSPIFLLGAGDCSSGATGIIVAGGSALRVYGTADVNAGDIAGGSGCKSMSVGTDAGNYLAGDTQIYSGANGGTCVASGSSTCPTITNYSPAHTDPYASLPTPAGVPSGACTGTNPAPTGNAYLPGVYPQALNIPATATFSGTYIFCAGLSFTNGARVTGTNVLFYFKGGTLTEGGDSRVALSAATTGAYKGLVAWQVAGDATTMSISNGGQFALTGAIYAPSAQVLFTGGSVTTSVTSIVSKTISLSGGATVTIGSPSTTPLSFSLPAGFVAAWPKSLVYTSPSFTGAGGDGSYSWSASNLPAGLTMDPDTGVITGTPTVTGAKSVTVTLSDALGDDVATQTFTLTIDALPTLTTTSPASGGQGAINQSITINGTGFINGAGLSAAFSGTGITVNSTTWVSATKLTANLGIAANAATSARDVTVTNPDTGTVTKTGMFTVNAAPTVTSISPASGGQGATTLSVTINGGGFVSGAGLAASFSGTGITVNSTTWVSAAKLTASVTIAANATTGVRDVSVTNPDGGTGTGSSLFTVNAAPTITSVTPPTAPKSTTLNVVIRGTGFVNGAGVTFVGSNLPTVNTTTWNNSGQITVNVTLSSKAKTWDVIVTNPDGGTATASAAFSST